MCSSVSVFKCKCRNVSVQVQVWKCQCVSVSVEVSVFKGFSGRTLRNAFGKKTINVGKSARYNTTGFTRRSAMENLRVGMRLHAMYAADQKYYSAEQLGLQVLG